VSDEQAGQIADYLNTLATAAPAAPTTLPKAGAELAVSVWSIMMLVTGFVMLLAGALTLARRKA
jgi:hypothetical protein